MPETKGQPVVTRPDWLAAGTVETNVATIGAVKADAELPGLGAFSKGHDGNMFHTYSSYPRGHSFCGAA